MPCWFWVSLESLLYGVLLLHNILACIQCHDIGLLAALQVLKVLPVLVAASQVLLLSHYTLTPESDTTTRIAVG